MTCPCGTRQPLEACCGRFLDAGLAPDTPERLMRSRYSAYALRRALYLRESWHPRTRPSTIELDAETTWLSLEIIGADAQGEDHGTVEFIARFRRGGAAHALHERSRFERRRGRWVYVDGDILA